MRGELVALDLETTGLNAEEDAIIEVGVVRMNDGLITETYSTLVNPGRPIPAYTTYLTGIRGADVEGAPAFADVLPKLTKFVGDAPIVGHNIGFDLGFLYRHAILRSNLRVDTYDLAAVLLPRAPRYSLAGLTAHLNIELEHAHRALDDARASALLYWELWQRTCALPHAVLSEITRAAKGLDWDARVVFKAALLESRPPSSVPAASNGVPFTRADDISGEIQPGLRHQPIALDSVAALFEAGGALSQHLPGFEPRSQQVAMAQAVAQAFNQARHTIVEAGTGTGKSLAYLIPAILWATSNSERVVISTNTINLQDQLLLSDIPALTDTLGIPFRAAVLKGRSNYLCPRRLAAVRRRHPTHPDELRTLAKVLVWLLESSSGDKGEITLRGPVEHNTWQRLSAEDEGCGLDRCESAMQGACPFYKARKAAEAAHLVIVNHALLLADASSDNQVLPNYHYLIVDEAHHLEEATTNSLAYRLDEATLFRRLADLGGPGKGLLGDLLHSAKPVIPEKQFARLAAFVANISAAAAAMEAHIRALFVSLREFFNEASTQGRPGDFVTQLRLTLQLRQRASFATCQNIWLTLQEFFVTLGDAMNRLNDGLSKLGPYPIPDHHDLLSSTAAAARHLKQIESQLTAFILNPSDNVIYWINAGQNLPQLTLHSAPLHIGPLVEANLWHTKEAVVLTSSTLQTAGSFDHLSERLHTDDFETVALGSPFDYRASTLVFVPTDIPEPTDPNYQGAVERTLVELAAALNGRVLALFTSYSQLRQTAQAIAPRLALGNIMVYDQSEGGSRQALLDGFRSTERAVLMGTKSFWEGIDIPGDALSALVIARLPFAVPNEPVFAARAETYPDSFNKFTLPDAILRFRQGFGRLIRTRTDRGIVVILDKRISSKGYGATFLESLPDCTIQHGSLRVLPEAAQNWLAMPPA